MGLSTHLEESIHFEEDLKSFFSYEEATSDLFQDILSHEDKSKKTTEGENHDGDYYTPLVLQDMDNKWGLSTKNYKSTVNVLKLKKGDVDGQSQQFPDLDTKTDDSMNQKPKFYGNMSSSNLPSGFYGHSRSIVNPRHGGPKYDSDDFFSDALNAFAAEETIETNHPLSGPSNIPCHKFDTKQSISTLFQPQGNYQGSKNGIEESSYQKKSTPIQQLDHIPMRHDTYRVHADVGSMSIPKGSRPRAPGNYLDTLQRDEPLSETSCHREDPKGKLGPLWLPRSDSQVLKNDVQCNYYNTMISPIKQSNYQIEDIPPISNPEEQIQSFMYTYPEYYVACDIHNTDRTSWIMKNKMNISRRKLVNPNNNEKVPFEIVEEENIIKDHHVSETTDGLYPLDTQSIKTIHNPSKKKIITGEVVDKGHFPSVLNPTPGSIARRIKVTHTGQKRKQVESNDSSRQLSHDSFEHVSSNSYLKPQEQDIENSVYVSMQHIPEENHLKAHGIIPRTLSKSRFRDMALHLKVLGNSISIHYFSEKMKNVFFQGLTNELTSSLNEITNDQKRLIYIAVRRTRLDLFPKFLGALKMIYDDQTNSISFRKKPTFKDEIERGWEIFCNALKRWENVEPKDTDTWFSTSQEKAPRSSADEDQYESSRREMNTCTYITESVSIPHKFRRFPNIQNHDMFDWSDPLTSLRHYLCINFKQRPTEVYLWYLLQEWHNSVKGPADETFPAFSYRGKLLKCYPDPNTHHFLPSD